MITIWKNRPCLTAWLEYHVEKKIVNIGGPGYAVAKLMEQRIGTHVISEIILD